MDRRGDDMVGAATRNRRCGAGGDGFDTPYGGRGDDHLSGGSDDDRLFGGRDHNGLPFLDSDLHVVVVPYRDAQARG